MLSPLDQSLKPSKRYTKQVYWRERSDMLYYRYVDYIIRCVASNAQRMIDVGSGNCPYLEWFDWIPDSISIDIRHPYTSPSVKGIRGDILQLSFPARFDICTCLQVLEHVPDPSPFAKRLLELSDVVVVSVPYKWSVIPKPTSGHLHDPVTYGKVAGWFGREANYRIVVKEPFQKRHNERLIAIFARDSAKTFGPEVTKGRAAFTRPV